MNIPHVGRVGSGSLQTQRRLVSGQKLMPLGRAVFPAEAGFSYGTHVLDHLAAHGAGLAAGQIAVVALLQVDADLPWRAFSY